MLWRESYTEKTILLPVCHTDGDPGDSSQEDPCISLNQSLPMPTWCYLSHFQWRCFLCWGWHTSWHSCGTAGIFWWRWQCWGSHPFPAETAAQRGKPIFLKVCKIAPHYALVHLWRAPCLPYISCSPAHIPDDCFNIRYSSTWKLLSLSPLVFSMLKFFLNSSWWCFCSMTTAHWVRTSGQIIHSFNIKCPQRLPAEFCWLDLVRTQPPCFRSYYKFTVS